MSSRFAGLALLSTVAVHAAVDGMVLVAAAPVLARDGSGGGGSSGSGSGGGGSSGGGSGSSGHSGQGSSSGSGQGSSGGTGSGDGGGSNSGGSNGGGSGRDGGSGTHDGNQSSKADDGGTGRHGVDSGPLDDDPGRDHDAARDAVLLGTALPFAKVLPTVRASVEGDVLDVRLRRLVSGILAYDVTVLSAEGQYRSIVIDAKRNRIIQSRQR